jgi:hypothetical protein
MLSQNDGVKRIERKFFSSPQSSRFHQVNVYGACRPCQPGMRNEEGGGRIKIRIKRREGKAEVVIFWIWPGR